jgi:hypothetical protein
MQFQNKMYTEIRKCIALEGLRKVVRQLLFDGDKQQNSTVPVQTA